jgi:hypothetical protein
LRQKKKKAVKPIYFWKQTPSLKWYWNTSLSRKVLNRSQ